MKFNFNKGDLARLFLIVSFPIHIWWIVMIFRDVNWIAERTNAWDSIGFAAYSLSYALVESVFTYLIVLIASFLLPAAWSKAKRINLLGVIVFGLTFWFIVEQVVQIYGPSRMQPIVIPFAQLPNPIQGFNILVGILVLISFVVPTYLIACKENVNKWVSTIFERLTLLSGLYIFFDLAAIAIIVLRNKNG